MSWLTDIGFFALLFFVLVFVHELGHYLCAKWMGIRVERFAIGMGPTLLAFTKGDTEYKLGLLPVGGYVKMSGDDPSKEYSEAEKRVGFLTQKPPAKLLVVFGGPLFNLLLPIFLFGIMLLTGVPTPRPIVGTMEKGLPAETSGLQAGDRIQKINGQPISKWNDVETSVEKSHGETLHLTVERIDPASIQAKTVLVDLQPKLLSTKNRFSEDVQQYRVGLGPAFSIPQIFFSDKNSVLAKAGFEPFDRVLSVNSQPIFALEEFRSILDAAKPGPMTLEISRGDKSFSKSFNIPEGKDSVEKRLGYFGPSLILGYVEPKSPAAKAGLEKGDRLVSIDSVNLKDFEEVSKAITGSGGKPILLVWNRLGTLTKAEITPEKTVIPDPLLGKDNPLAREAAYRIGIAPAMQSDTSLLVERSWNPLDWLKRGLTETGKMIAVTLEALSRLFTGRLSLKLVGSPIMIYKVASYSYRMAGGGYFGWFSFVSELALLSISLGLVNLLPIPVLDGGHAAFFIIEWIRGRPVSLKVMEVMAQIGLVFIACLFAVLLYNDVVRYDLLDKFLKLFH